jgi:hypothetical protein
MGHRHASVIIDGIGRCPEALCDRRIGPALLTAQEQNRSRPFRKVEQRFLEQGEPLAIYEDRLLRGSLRRDVENRRLVDDRTFDARAASPVSAIPDWSRRSVSDEELSLLQPIQDAADRGVLHRRQGEAFVLVQKDRPRDLMRPSDQRGGAGMEFFRRHEGPSVSRGGKWGIPYDWPGALPRLRSVGAGRRSGADRRLRAAVGRRRQLSTILAVLALCGGEHCKNDERSCIVLGKGFEDGRRYAS